MCSTPAQRIADIGQAIDDLAVDALAAYAPAWERRPATAEPPAQDDNRHVAAKTSDTAEVNDTDKVSDTDRVVIRLAELWARLAELDPEMARRLPGYRALPAPVGSPVT